MRSPQVRRGAEKDQRHDGAYVMRGGAQIPQQRTATVPVPTHRPEPELDDLAVIVPTRNESGNVAPLVERLAAVLRGREAEVVFVDDSDDDTPDQVRHVAKTSELPVRLHHREHPERSGGLGGAVIAGLREVERTYAVVMDGDLQHPPELVPQLVSDARLHGADVVVASRHVEGGSSDGLSNMVRVAVSRLSILLAKFFFPRRLRGISDPMSGYFLVRTAAIDVDVLKPQGFKILLEIMARTPSLRRHEVPFSFGERLCGESKASVREGGRFLRQVAGLEADRVRGARLTRTSSGVFNRGAFYGAIGLTGLVVNTLLMWLLVEGTAGVSYLLAAVIATQISTTWNFVLVDSLVYRGPKRLTWSQRWLGVMALSNVVLVLRVPLLALLVSGLGVHYLLANVITLVLGFLVRFSGQERLSLVKESP